MRGWYEGVGGGGADLGACVPLSPKRSKPTCSTPADGLIEKTAAAKLENT